MDLVFELFELEMKPMTCAIMDQHWRWDDSLLFKEDYISSKVLGYVLVARS
jgi:hypothetical protein